LPAENRDLNFIQSVDNALIVLEAICAEGDEVRVSHLSKRLGMNKTSLFRYLATFESRGYLEKAEDTRKYRLGIGAFELGQKLLSHMGLLREAKPVIERLAREFNEAVYLVVPRADQTLMFDLVDTTQQVKIISMVGNRYPLDGTSAGMVILAYNESQRVFPGSALPQPGLAEILEQGFAVDRGCFGDGIASLAVPLLDAQARVPASLCMVGPEFRLTRKKIDQELLPALIETGRIISSKLGYIEHYMNKASRK